jgi:hypothetical protein
MSAALVASFAIKVCFASVMGIVCGWQPMPDGSQSYECVVQLEPALIDALRRGDSIPLAVDVPENIRPIGRIRLTVGSGELPQVALAAKFKPWPTDEKQPRDGIVETQFTTNNNVPNNGYGYQQPASGQVVPVNDTISNAQNAFARQLQNGGQAVQDSINKATQDILPPETNRSISNAVNQAGQQLGTNLQNAGDTVREDIRQMFGAEPVANNNGQILPPGSANTAQPNQQAQQILPADSGTAASSRRRLDQPITSNQTNDWQSSLPATNNSAANNQNNGGTGFAPARPMTQPPAARSNSDPNAAVGGRYNAAPSFSTSNSSILPQNNGLQAATQPTNQPGRYDGFAQPQNAGPATADARNNQVTNQPVSAGPSFPAFTPTAGLDQSITPTPQPPSSASVAEIRRDMFNQPANAEIKGANGLPIGQQPVSSPPPTSAPMTSAPTTPSASSFGWETKPQAQPVGIPTAGAPASVFPLLLSWVLLSGSGAGNLYLFWSYLDVRNKYRDLVDEAARRISGRRVRD